MTVVGKGALVTVVGKGALVTVVGKGALVTVVGKGALVTVVGKVHCGEGCTSDCCGEGCCKESVMCTSITRYGRFVSEVSYFICESKQTIRELFHNLRADRKVRVCCAIPPTGGLRASPTFWSPVPYHLRRSEGGLCVGSDGWI